MSVEFRLLGPLDALVDGRPVALGGRHQRAVLALLLASANELVPLERVIDGIWEDSPPDTAANLVQGYVSQLRKLLGRDAIATHASGRYACAVTQISPSALVTPARRRPG